MRTLIILLTGLVTWAVCLGSARVFAGPKPAAMSLATWIFVALWFLAAAANLWVGVAKAGYTFQEELPIFLVIFLSPTAAAVFVKWKWL